MSEKQNFRKPGHGAVAVLVEDEKFLVIRRSEFVRAPNLLCFVGGTIEAGETPEEAIVREAEEEVSLKVKAIEQIWQSKTRWGTLLEWVVVERLESKPPTPNPSEVAECMWLTAEELLHHPDLLPSVPAFYAAWAKGEFSLPSVAGVPSQRWSELQ